MTPNHRHIVKFERKNAHINYRYPWVRCTQQIKRLTGIGERIRKLWTKICFGQSWTWQLLCVYLWKIFGRVIIRIWLWCWFIEVFHSFVNIKYVWFMCRYSALPNGGAATNYVIIFHLFGLVVHVRLLLMRCFCGAAYWIGWISCIAMDAETVIDVPLRDIYVFGLYHLGCHCLADLELHRNSI